MGAARRKRERRVIRGDPLWARRKSQRHLRDGGLERESDRGVRASRPGNSGGAKALTSDVLAKWVRIEVIGDEPAKHRLRSGADRTSSTARRRRRLLVVAVGLP